MLRGLRDGTAAAADPEARLLQAGWTRAWHATEEAFARLVAALAGLHDELRGSLDGWDDGEGLPLPRSAR